MSLALKDSGFWGKGMNVSTRVKKVRSSKSKAQNKNCVFATLREEEKKLGV